MIRTLMTLKGLKLELRFEVTIMNAQIRKNPFLKQLEVVAWDIAAAFYNFISVFFFS